MLEALRRCRLPSPHHPTKPLRYNVFVPVASVMALCAADQQAAQLAYCRLPACCGALTIGPAALPARHTINRTAITAAATKGAGGKRRGRRGGVGRVGVEGGPCCMADTDSAFACAVAENDNRVHLRASRREGGN